MMDVAAPVHAATLFDGHADPLFEHEAVVTHTALHTGLICVAGRGAVQVRTGGLAGGDTVGVMAVLRARRY